MAKFLACLCLCALAASTSAAEYYRWTDANGVTHYTDKPPVGVNAEKLKSNARSAPPAPPQAGAQESDGARAERAARCQTERERLETLKKNRSVQIRQASGELKSLSPQEHQEEIAFTEKAIEVYCNYMK